MAEKTKKAKKVSAGKVVGETIKFLACPPYKIGEWISEAVDKKAAQKEAVADSTIDKKRYEEVCKATNQMTAEELTPKATEEVKKPEVKEEAKNESDKT